MGRILTLTPNPALDFSTTTQKFDVGPKLRCTDPRIDPGSGGINVSRVLTRLGGDTLALFAGGGWTGDVIAAALEKGGVSADQMSIAATTRHSFSLREKATGDVMRFVTPGPLLQAAESEKLLERLEHHPREASLVVGSGSLPKDESNDLWVRAAAVCSDAATRFLLDSHDRALPALEQIAFADDCVGDETTGIRCTIALPASDGLRMGRTAHDRL